ncbi:uncharacterized protein LOC116348506 [Contarinia nasturtii]|uniref:uncharacterized protein LOC116348506 n=1 Tax=Contarinia nasturtii TaxID=265458 RepID=UPI0012D3B641|nr:uncharacterized protein LOC116348506 [Contarinia nasturtii]
MLRRSARIAATQRTRTAGKRRRPPAPPTPDTTRKRRKLSDANDQNDISLIMAPTKINGSKRKLSILDLNDYCLEEIFEWLSLEHLKSVFKTCTRLQQLAGRYFQRTYSNSCIRFENGYPYIRTNGGLIECDHFNAFYQNILICSDNIYIDPIDNELIQKIYDYGYGMRMQMSKRKIKPKITITEVKINWDKVLHLYNIGIIRGYDEHTDREVWRDLHDSVLRHCVNLKKFVMVSRFIPKVSSKWLHQKYPTLEYLQLKLNFTNDIEMNKLMNFLQSNPNIRALSIDLCRSNDFFDAALKSSVQLDELTIDNYNPHEVPVSLLNQLYDRGFYKRLNVLQESHWNVNIFKVKGLELLRTPILSEFDVNRSSMAIVKTLFYTGHDDRFIKEIEYFAKNLVNLERLWLNARIEQHNILWFIKCAPKLKEIFADRFDKELDVSSWNKEREKLPRARKVTIYVDEETFLKTKWNTESTDNLSLITIKRTQSYSAKMFGPFDLISRALRFSSNNKIYNKPYEFV